MLLLTNDNELEESVADALSEIGGISHLTRAAGDALETICGVDDLDLAIIDFEHGPHGMTLLSAISTLREHLPVIVTPVTMKNMLKRWRTQMVPRPVFPSRQWRRNSRMRFANLANQGRNRSLSDRGESENANNESQRFSRTKQDRH